MARPEAINWLRARSCLVAVAATPNRNCSTDAPGVQSAGSKTACGDAPNQGEERTGDEAELRLAEPDVRQLRQDVLDPTTSAAHAVALLDREFVVTRRGAPERDEYPPIAARVVGPGEAVPPDS